MKKLGVLLLGTLLAMPVLADEVPDDEAPVEEAPVEAPPAEEAAPVEEATPEEAVAEAPVEEPPAEEPPAEEAPVEEGEPTRLYVGADYAQVDVSYSSDALKAQFGGEEFRSTFYRGRVGVRVFEVIGLEAHFGVPDDDGSEPGRVEIAEYWGVFAVPTATIFDLFEMAVPLGYSKLKVAQATGAEEEFGRVGFGLNIELPLKGLVEALPDIRIGGGGMVYHAENHARIYGYHVGARYDFAF